MRSVLRLLLAAFAAAPLLLAASTASAQRTIEDCEKILDANAYNNCLASFGPRMRGGRAARREAVAPERPSVSRSARRKGRVVRGRRGASAYVAVPSRPGRVRVEIRRRR